MAKAREWTLIIPGDPVPWSPSSKVGSAPNSPRKVPDRQARHASKIVEAWNRDGKDRLWLPKGNAVALRCQFFVSRPKNHYRTGKHARELKPDRIPTECPHGKPDLSNLVKMVEDALTGILWADDDQVCGIQAQKRFCHWWDQPKSVVEILTG